MNGLALCSGSGMLEEGIRGALEALGYPYRTVCHVEREAHAAATLVARMEDAALDPAPVWDDVKTFRGRRWRGVVDIVTGGYPCQPFSNAGRRRGTRDPRHLWPDIARIVREVRPSICFFENVPGHLQLGFRAVRADLRAMGFRVAAGIFSAEEVGATHRRERLFILAHRESRGQPGFGLSARSRPQGSGAPDPDRCGGNVAYACGTGLAGAEFGGQPGTTERWKDQGATASQLRRTSVAHADGEGRRQAERREPQGGGPDDARQGIPLHAPGPRDIEGWHRVLSIEPTLEPALRRTADGMAGRVDRLRLCGNGVVPLAVAYAFVTLGASLASGDCAGRTAEPVVMEAAE